MLAKVPLFDGLTEEEMAKVLEPATVRAYPRGTALITEGDVANSLYILQAGSAKVFLRGGPGRELLLNMLKPGDHFGELALIQDSTRTASVSTLERSVFLVLEKEDFLRVLGTYPSISLSLLRYLTRRMRAVTDTVKGLAMKDVHWRTSRALFEMASDKDGKLVINRKVTQQEIANRVGASREMISRVMKDLVSAGYVEVGQQQITVHAGIPHDF